MATLDERLANGSIVSMHGGVSTEMESKGLAMGNDVWSGIDHVINADGEVTAYHAEIDFADMP